MPINEYRNKDGFLLTAEPDSEMDLVLQRDPLTWVRIERDSGFEPAPAPEPEPVSEAEPETEAADDTASE